MINLIHIGLGLTAIALAIMFGGAFDAMSRNSVVSDKIFNSSLIAAAFIELIALLIFSIMFLNK